MGKVITTINQKEGHNMRHRSKWRKRSDDSTIGIDNTSSLVNTTSSTHPSTTFTIHNNNNNVLSNLITNTSRLLHSKSTYFYNGWERVIPSVCILALLVGLYSFVNPTTRHDSNSIRIDSSMLGLGSNKAYASDTDGVPVNNNTDVMSTRASDNNVSMTITPDTSSSGGSSSGTIDATVGQTAYSNHIVKLTGDRIKSYVLSISYTNDSTALVNNSTNTEEGAINSTITGANNKTGDNLDSNTWGYSWSDNTSTSSNTLTYHTMPISTNPATIKSATEGTIPNNTLDMTGKLAFAVKFGDKAVAGHYTTNVLLSLAIQPAEVVREVEYSLIYDANGGSNPPATQTYTDTSGAGSHMFTVSGFSGSNKPQGGGCSYGFYGWSTTQDGSVEYKPNETIKLQASNPSRTLYAVWDGSFCV